MKISIPTVKGEIPRVSPRALPDGFATEAANCRLLSGDLEAWKNFKEETVLCSTGNINTIYLLAESIWLEFTDSQLGAGAVSVDIAKGIIPGDTTNRTYLTGLDAPRFTNTSLATSPIFAAGVSWTAATSPPKPTDGSAVGIAHGGYLVSHNGYLYSIGGYDNSDTNFGVYRSADNGTTWTTAMPAGSAPWAVNSVQKITQGAVSYNGRIYILVSPSASAVTATECWSSIDGTTGSWTLETSSVNGTNWPVALVVHAGQMYAFFGRASGLTGAAASVVRSSNGSGWTTVTGSPAWSGIGDFNVASLNGNLYTVGGRSDNTTTTNAVYKSVDNGATWTLLTVSGLTARRSPAVFAYNNLLWAMGGGNAGGTSTFNDIWYSSDGAGWTQATAAAPWSSRYDMSHAVHNATMYIGPGTHNGAIRASLYYAAGAVPGVCPFPVSTHLLGVPAPTVAPTASPVIGPAFALNIVDSGTDLSNWTISEQINVGGVIKTVTVVSGAYQIKTQNLPNSAAFMNRDFGFYGATSMSFSFTWNYVPTSSGNMIFDITFAGGASIAYLGQGNIRNTNVSSVPIAPLSASTNYRMTITGNRISQDRANYSFELRKVSDNSLADSGSFTGVWASGVNGFSANNGDTGSGTPITNTIDDILVTAAGTFDDGRNNFTTSYVYTFVNDFGEEGAPSPTSALITRNIGAAATITTATSATSGYGVTTKRIYRAVTGTTGTSFQFVTEISLATAAYTDSLTDAQLGEILPSSNWDLPPSDLRGIIALPNGVMAGFSKNRLCFSVQNHPHAWPIEFQLTTDFPIVAIGAIDTNVVIATQTFPYLASGNDPANYSMTKLEVQQGCVSKRSLSYLKGVGVIYASPDGLVSISGNGGVQILTEAVFSRRDWQALNPSTIIAAVHDDRYFAFYQTNLADPTTKAGLAIEAKQGGFGKISLLFHAQATYVDVLNDKLYLLLDLNSTAAALTAAQNASPEITDQIVPDSKTVYSFDEFGGGSPGPSPLLPYIWTSKVYKLAYPACFRMCQVKAHDYNDLYLMLKDEDDQVLATKHVTSQKEFVLQDNVMTKTLKVQLSGTSRVQQIELAEDVMELE